MKKQLENHKLIMLVGPHGGGKTTYIYNEMLNYITDENGNIDLNKKAYLIVPEQDTKEKQKAFMDFKLNLSHSMINCDVISFDRLCHIVFSKLMIEDKYALNIIQDDMKALLCQIAIEKRADELSSYKRKSKKIGFSEKLASAISEFYTYNINQEKINKILTDEKVNQTIKNELAEISIIYDEFDKMLKDMNLNIMENKLKILAQNIDKTDIFDNSIVFFDGFTGLSPVQKEVFNKIKSKANKTYVSIDYRKKELEKYLSHYYDKLDFNDKYEKNIFHISDLFMESICDKENIKDSIVYIEEGHNEKYKNSQDLKHLEENIFSEDINNKNQKNATNIFINRNKNINTELEFVINKIIELTRINDEKISYNDIKIIVPNLENYRDEMISKFEKYNIPLFIDNSQSIFNSPYVKCIRAFINLCENDFSYESIMGYMNCGLFDKDGSWNNKEDKSYIPDKSIYYFDNALRMFGVDNYYSFLAKNTFMKKINYYNKQSENSKGDNDLKNETAETKKKIVYRNEVEEHSSDVLKVYKSIIYPLMKLYEEKVLSNKEHKYSLSEFVVLIKTFLTNLHIDIIYENYVSCAKKNSEKLLADKDIVLIDKSQEKIEKILNLLELIGNYNQLDTKYNLQELSQILDSAIDIFKIKSIPFSMDQIVVGDLMRSRFDNPKVLFFLGMNDSSLPQKHNDDNIINDKMREAFTNNDIELSQNIAETVYNSRFYTYLALTNPSEKLYLSYTNTNSEGQADYKSRFLMEVEELYDVIDESIVEPNKLPIYDIKQMKDFIALNNANNKKVISNIDYYVSNYDKLGSYKKEIVNNTIISKQYYDLLKEIDIKNKNSSEDNKIYDNINLIHTNIDTDLIKKIYGDTFKTSATAMEKFANCPYKYFLENMLGLVERQNNDIDTRNIGNIFHYAIEKFFENGNYYTNIIDSNGKETINEIDENKLESIINEISEEAIEKEFESKAKKNDKKSQIFLKQRLKEIIYVSIKHMIKQLRFQSPLVKISHELEFDDYAIGNNKDTIFKGRIDQVELLKAFENKDKYGNDSENLASLNKDVLYIKIVDYKSSTKKIDMNDILNGKMIQFIIYLDYIKKVLDQEITNDIIEKDLITNKTDIKKYKKIEYLGTFYKSIIDNIVFINSEKVIKYKNELEKNQNIVINNYKDLLKEYVKIERDKTMKMTGIINISDNKYKILDKDATANKVTYGTSYRLKNTNFISFNPDNHNSLQYDNDFETLINSVKAKIEEQVKSIKEGKLPIAPTGNICNYCPFAGSCGKEKFGIEEDDINE